MSILIKGMEIPKSCIECDFCADKAIGDCDFIWVCNLLNKEVETEKRLDNCPLIEIKPHGRLIDADAMIEKYNLLPHRYDSSMVGMISNCDLFDALVHDLRKEPTIIEAEEANE